MRRIYDVSQRTEIALQQPAQFFIVINDEQPRRSILGPAADCYLGAA